MKSPGYIQRLIDGDNRALNDIYSSFRSGFIAYARSALALNFDDAQDLFQESCILLLTKVRKGEIKEELANPQVGTYLKTTGKLLNANRCRKRGIPTVHDGPDIPDEESDCSEEEQRMQAVRDVVTEIPDPCSTLLELQYFQQKKQAEIAKVMGYGSADTVKTMSSRCRGKVKVLIKQRFKELGYE